MICEGIEIYFGLRAGFYYEGAGAHYACVPAGLGVGFQVLEESDLVGIGCHGSGPGGEEDGMKENGAEGD